MKSPIIIFAFNRIDILKQMIESLLDNKEVKDSDLFVFVDGARCKEEEKKVIIVQSYLKSISGFKHIEYFFAKENKGLGQSIIDGVSQIINKYGKAIILEDDLILSKNFLSFINQGLNRYKDEKNVFSICGYTNKIKLPPHYSYDAYFCTRSSSWGWGTWADRWNSVDWDLTDWNNTPPKLNHLIDGAVLIVGKCLMIGEMGKMNLGLFASVSINFCKINYLYFR